MKFIFNIKLSVLVLFLFSCSDTSKKALPKMALVKENTEKSIIFPDSLILINRKIGKESFNHHLKLVSYLDADCSACIAQINKITEFLESNNLNEKVTPIFITYGTSYKTLEYYTNEKEKFSSPIFFDKNYGFLYENDIPELLEKKSMLLDTDNHIILKGSIFGNEEKKMEYLEIISMNTKELYHGL